jgi:excisionase family DNA binding protein
MRLRRKPYIFLGGDSLVKKETVAEPLPMLKSVEQMSRVSGIGENKLRELMDSGKLEYVQNGNRRLIADDAIWKWYEGAKIIGAVLSEGGQRP